MQRKGLVHWGWLVLVAIIFLFLGNIWHIAQEKQQLKHEQTSAEITLQIIEQEIMANRPFIYQGVEFVPIGKRCYQYRELQGNY